MEFSLLMLAGSSGDPTIGFPLPPLDGLVRSPNQFISGHVPGKLGNLAVSSCFHQKGGGGEGNPPGRCVNSLHLPKVVNSVSDPYSSNPDSDLAKNLNPDPDPERP